MWDDLPSHLSTCVDRFLADEIQLSHSYQRCRRARLSRDAPAARHTLTGKALSDLFIQYGNLAAYAHLLFVETYRHLPDPREILILTDGEAHIIDIVSHPDVLERAAIGFGIKPGTSLGEDSCGTNAVALAIRHRGPVSVRGVQHYCRIFARWYSVAVPVTGIDGTVAACLGISMPASGALGERTALAKCLADELTRFLRHDVHNTPADCATSTTQQSASPHVELTARQQQVLSLFAQGASYKQIARQLGINSIKTVEQHLDAVRSKLGAHSRRECIQRATQDGLLHNPMQ